MTQRNKLIENILDNPKNVRFDNACRAAEWIGFRCEGGKGSHWRYLRPGEPDGLNSWLHTCRAVRHLAKPKPRHWRSYKMQLLRGSRPRKLLGGQSQSQLSGSVPKEKYYY